MRAVRRIYWFCVYVMISALVLLISVNFVCPQSLNIYEGEKLNFNTKIPLSFTYSAGTSGVLNEDGSVSAQQGLASYTVDIKLFGVIPVKTVSVNVVDTIELIPGGNTIGIKIFTKGLLAIGFSDITTTDNRVCNLAAEYDLRLGDNILTANGEELSSVEQLSSIVSASEGNKIALMIKRNGVMINKEIAPAATKDGYKLGVWVRDSTAGIGTLTFIDKSTEKFGALGHPITDSDSGVIMPVSDGSILPASIFNIKKGERGIPGELKGLFKGTMKDIGTIEKNTEQGIFGAIKPENINPEANPVAVASKVQIKEGAAFILSNIHDDTVEKFDIEIERVSKFNTDSYKDLVIKVTDDKLLEDTGGIVQGM